MERINPPGRVYLISLILLWMIQGLTKGLMVTLNSRQTHIKTS